MLIKWYNNVNYYDREIKNTDENSTVGILLCTNKNKTVVALYFTIFPNEVDIFLKEVEESQKRYKEYEEELYKKVIKHINSMSKSDFQESLVEILNIAPEWVYDRFVRDRIDY